MGKYSVLVLFICLLGVDCAALHHPQTTTCLKYYQKLTAKEDKHHNAIRPPDSPTLGPCIKWMENLPYMTVDVAGNTHMDGGEVICLKYQKG